MVLKAFSRKTLVLLQDVNDFNSGRMLAILSILWIFIMMWLVISSFALLITTL